MQLHCTCVESMSALLLKGSRVGFAQSYRCPECIAAAFVDPSNNLVEKSGESIKKKEYTNRATIPLLPHWPSKESYCLCSCTEVADRVASMGFRWRRLRIRLYCSQTNASRLGCFVYLRYLRLVTFGFLRCNLLSLIFKFILSNNLLSNLKGIFRKLPLFLSPFLRVNLAIEVGKHI